MSKEYMTTITILDPPEGIKPGLTAEARIMVNEIRDALILPVQSIFEYGGKTYCITFEDGKWEKHEIKTGATNDKEVVVLDGLKEGDRVVLGAWAHRDKVDLPKLLPGTEENGADGPPGPLENRQGENRQGEARPDGGQRERGGEAGPPGNRQGAPREGSKPKEGPRGEKPGDDKPAPPAGPRTGENKSETPRPAPAT